MILKRPMALKVLSFAQAEQGARKVFGQASRADLEAQAEREHAEWLARHADKADAMMTQLAEGDAAEVAGKATVIWEQPGAVARACRRYIEWLKSQNKPYKPAESALTNHVIETPYEADQIDKLTVARLEALRDTLVRRDPNNPEVERRSKDSSNRIMTSVKAALNRETDDATAALRHKVKPFQAKGKGKAKKVGQPRDVVLDTDECARLIEAAISTSVDRPVAHRLSSSRWRVGQVSDEGVQRRAASVAHRGQQDRTA